MMGKTKFLLTLNKELKEKIKERAKSLGVSTTAFINMLLNEKIERKN